MRIKIEVTKEDIRLGAEGSSGDCPIALALKRRFLRQNLSIYVGDDVFTFDGGNRWHKLPKRASVFSTAQMHNHVEKLKPFKFFIDIPKGVGE